MLSLATKVLFVAAFALGKDLPTDDPVCSNYDCYFSACCEGLTCDIDETSKTLGLCIKPEAEAEATQDDPPKCSTYECYFIDCCEGYKCHQFGKKAGYCTKEKADDDDDDKPEDAPKDDEPETEAAPELTTN